MASRYSNIPEIQYNNTTILSTSKIKPASFFQKFNPTVIQVGQEDTLDSLAFEYYKDGTLFWIIMMANGLELPTDIQIGDKIIIPLDFKSIVQAINNVNGT